MEKTALVVLLKEELEKRAFNPMGMLRTAKNVITGSKAYTGAAKAVNTAKAGFASGQQAGNAMNLGQRAVQGEGIIGRAARGIKNVGSAIAGKGDFAGNPLASRLGAVATRGTGVGTAAGVLGAGAAAHGIQKMEQGRQNRRAGQHMQSNYKVVNGRLVKMSQVGPGIGVTQPTAQKAPNTQATTPGLTNKVVMPGLTSTPSVGPTATGPTT